jgi:hypothetical protein
MDVIHALVGSGIDVLGSRGALLQFIAPLYVGTLPVGGPPSTQLLNDIGRMNQQERLTTGEVPLEIYLRNALLLVAQVDAADKAVRAALDKVTQRSSGAPSLDLAAMPEIKEKIVHADDTVSLAFMDAGVKAAAAVMRLRVPRFENGQAKTSGGHPVMYLGTGWLLTRELVMTNHHVVNARNDGEPGATEPDLRRQAAGVEAHFDFDSDGSAGVRVTATGLVAWSAGLDYALLRIPAVDRAPLARAAAAIQDGDPVPVNIIQHPGGRPKRYGIRNNLVSASKGTELRYFTDTEGGSSGSPVFNDRWEVVALHRAAKFVEGVQFQGKPTAYVNVGTHLSSILEDMHHHYPAILAEIG